MRKKRGFKDPSFFLCIFVERFLQMINSVRNTVLSILNKNNYGYISPADFNLYAKQAQLDIFEDYFYQYNYQINAENARRSGTGLADIKKGYEEVINIFSRIDFLSSLGGQSFSVPSETTTGFDYYLLNNVFIYTNTITTGVSTNAIPNQLEDNTKNFNALGIKVGDVVINTTTNVTAQVLGIVLPDTLLLDSDAFTVIGDTYTIYDGQRGVNEAEKVTNNKILMLNSSLLTTPTEMFPAYTQNGEVLTLYPNNITSFGQVRCQYIRYPQDPQWTYVQLLGGEPSFDQSQPDFQDFELPLDDEPTLVNKILQFAGMSIREIQAVQFAQAEENIETQSEK